MRIVKAAGSEGVSGRGGLGDDDRELESCPIRAEDALGIAKDLDTKVRGTASGSGSSMTVITSGP